MQGFKASFLLHLLFLHFVHTLQAQCSIDEVSLNTKVDKASLIIEGKIVGRKPFFDSQHSFIYTCNTVEVYKHFKGNLTTKNIYILTEGGTVGNKQVSVSPSTKTDTGEIGLFIIIPSSIIFPGDSTVQTYKFYSGIQGFIKYDLKTKTASDPFNVYTNIYNELYNSISKQIGKTYNIIKAFDINLSSISPANLRAGTAIIGNFSPTVTSAGTYSVITINGSGFGSVRGGSTVGFKNTNDGGKTFIQPFPNQYISWSDTQIKVKVPSKAGTGPIQVDVGSETISDDTLVVKYAELNASYDDNTSEDETNIIGLNYEGGMTWRMNVDVDADNKVKESFIRALTTWKCNTLINWKLGATTLVNKTKFDSTNVVTFGEEGSVSDGTLAVCYSYWNKCADWILEEADVVINPNANWEYGPELPTGNEYDFESVILHELGHGHQLGHVIDKADLMNYSIRNTEVKRTPGQNNIAAASDVLNRSISQSYCESPITILLSTGNCSDVYIENSDADFLIFPNPTSGFFSITTKSDVTENFKITLYNSLGSIITSVTGTQNSGYISLDLSEYPGGGIYFIFIDTGKKIVTRKIIFTK